MIMRTLRDCEGRELQERDLDLTGQDRVMDLGFDLLLMVDVFRQLSGEVETFVWKVTRLKSDCFKVQRSRNMGLSVNVVSYNVHYY